MMHRHALSSRKHICSRRVRKVTQEATTTFFYDGWNIVEERVAYTNGTASSIRYYWGKDLSGSLQGAGGVGGLIYLMVSNSNSQLQLYVPCYDNNGNIARYLDQNGSAVAQYTYDAFGKLIAKSGPLADFFRHRFSTKYFDPESGLYYYGYRFYHPALMRWLTRDPIEEDGGVNLYAMCGNAIPYSFDKHGTVKFVVPLDDFFKNPVNRATTQISKFVRADGVEHSFDVKFPLRKVMRKEYFWKVDFIARFTPPSDVNAGMHAPSNLSVFLFGNASGSLGGDGDMYKPASPDSDVREDEWGTPIVSNPERASSGIITRQQYSYPRKKFRFGYIAYKANIKDGVFKQIDENKDMYSVWYKYAPRLLPVEDLSVSGYRTPCEVVAIIYGDAGRPGSVSLVVFGGKWKK